MTKILAAILRNQVRTYSIIVAVLAVAGSFGLTVTAPQQAAILGFAALVLGGGQVVHDNVTPAP